MSYALFSDQRPGHIVGEGCKCTRQKTLLGASGAGEREAGRSARIGGAAAKGGAMTTIEVLRLALAEAVRNGNKELAKVLTAEVVRLMNTENQ